MGRSFIPGFGGGRPRAAADVQVPTAGTWDVYELADGAVRLAASLGDRAAALRAHPLRRPAVLARGGVVLSGNDRVDVPLLDRFKREVRALHEGAAPPALVRAPGEAERVGAPPSTSGPPRASDAVASARTRRSPP